MSASRAASITPAPPATAIKNVDELVLDAFAHAFRAHQLCRQGEPRTAIASVEQAYRRLAVLINVLELPRAATPDEARSNAAAARVRRRASTTKEVA